MRPALALLLVLAASGIAPGRAATDAPTALQPIPKLESRVTDLTGTLTAGQQADLEQRLADFEARKGTQIAVLLVPTTAPEAIEQYSIRVVEAWKLGRRQVDDGALLLIAKDDHALRIENGYGLEGVLTDAASNRIIDESMVPLLRQGQVFAAVSAGVDQMMRLIDGEPLPPPDRAWPRPAPNLNLIPVVLFAFFAVSAVLRSLFGRRAGAALSGGVTGLIVFLLTQTVLLALGAAVGAGVLALLLGASGGWASPGRGGWGGPFGGFGGGFGGGLGGGFGGSGGFSGGGGGFGGGGASGRW